MLDPTIVTLLDDQFGKELFSAYLYLSMANYYEEASLNGFANWFFVQAQEERDHAMLIRTYLLDNNAKMKMGAIKNPEGDFKDFLDPLKASLEHEQYVTRLPGQGFPHHAVLGLVCERTGRRRKNR